MCAKDNAVNTINATLTGDVEAVIEADASAASRVAPILNTLNMDFSSEEIWFGRGTVSEDEKYNLRLHDKIGQIDQYGLLSFIVMQICVFL